MSRRSISRKSLIRELCRGSRYIWIDVRWLNALGREEVQRLLHEHGYGDMRPA